MANPLREDIENRKRLKRALKSLAKSPPAFVKNTVFQAMEAMTLGLMASCHRKPGRSFTAGKLQSIMCTRCNAIYIGFLLSFLYLLASGAAFSSTMRLVYVAALLLPTALDGFSQLLGFRESSNELRIASGYLIGIAISVLASVAVHELFSIGLQITRTLPDIELMLFYIITVIPFMLLPRVKSRGLVKIVDSALMLSIACMYLLAGLFMLKIAYSALLFYS